MQPTDHVTPMPISDAMAEFDMAPAFNDDGAPGWVAPGIDGNEVRVSLLGDSDTAGEAIIDLEGRSGRVPVPALAGMAFGMARVLARTAPDALAGIFADHPRFAELISAPGNLSPSRVVTVTTDEVPTYAGDLDDCGESVHIYAEGMPDAIRVSNAEVPALIEAFMSAARVGYNAIFPVKSARSFR